MANLLSQLIYLYFFPYRDNEILDQMEDDDCEMGSNLGRLNLLLDQLNGLLQGKDGAATERRRAQEDVMLPFAGLLDFSGLEEWKKFEDLPPISDEEMAATDWDLLFKRIQSDRE